MTVVCVIQARMSSSRLPGKVLRPLLDKPMLYRMLERVSRSKTVDQLIVATSTDRSDDPIEQLCLNTVNLPKHVHCYRGDLDDVLARFSGALALSKADHIVRLTGDCPLSDPDVIDAIVELHLKTGADYTSNVMHPTLPDGFDVEVVSAHALMKAVRNAVLPSEREHVTPYIRFHPETFRLVDYIHKPDWSGYRLTVDYLKDFELIAKLFMELYPNDHCFGIQAVMALLAERPEWLEINADFERNEGFTKSLSADRAFLAQRNASPM